MKKLKNLGKEILEFVFADMSWVLWWIILAFFVFVGVKYVDTAEPYIDMLEYGWETLVLYFIALSFVWIFISDSRYNFISTWTIGFTGRILYEFYLLAELTGKYIVFILFTAIAIAIFLFVEIISELIVKYFKLEGSLSSNKKSKLWDMSNLFDDDDGDEFDEDDEDDGSKEIIKMINTEAYYVRAYSVMIRKVLRDHGNDNKILSAEEQEAWNNRVKKVASIIEEYAASGAIEEFVYSYFYMAYFCGEKYKDMFSKEKANKYLQDYINKGFFKEDKFNSMVEEAIEGFSTERKCDLITEVYEVVRPMVAISSIIENRIQRKEKREKIFDLKEISGMEADEDEGNEEDEENN